MYKFLRNFLFLFPTEGVHYFSMNLLRMLCSVPLVRSLVAAAFRPRNDLQQSVSKLPFSNPVGLGAGFDKNAKWLRELEALGFGFVEIGTVTPKAQPGNPKPRLFRLPEDRALVNRMGFNNDGAETVAARLKKWQEQVHADKAARLIIGGNIGKNKDTPNEEAWKDYEACFLALHPYVDYFVVNVSSPNTPGLRELQEKESLKKILRHLQMINNSKSVSRPLFLKIAPDLSDEQLKDVVDLVMEIHLDGIVATNTTISRHQLNTDAAKVSRIGAGGLSGLPIKARSTEVVKYIHERSAGTIPVIASGGIFTGADAKEKLAAGATLVQVWTGFIYEGPGIVKKICKGLQ